MNVGSATTRSLQLRHTRAGFAASGGAISVGARCQHLDAGSVGEVLPLTAVSTLIEGPSASQPTSRAQPSIAHRIWRARSAYGFIAPFYILFAAFSLFPIGYSVYLAFYSWNGLGPKLYVGWQNFSELFGDSEFWTSVENTVVLWLGHIVILFIVAMCLALLVNMVWLKGKTLFRAILLAPYMAAIAATSLIFSLIFTAKLGFLDELLGHVGIDINFLGSYT
ncbi:MAG TPA: sugar ABC transporter permease, partial [Acidimicrobiales bacterium]|nr:sugar ABC transporter permease [Acidimicrobiales bacterium]